MIIGDLDIFAFDIGETNEGDLRRVDVVVGGCYVCCDDNLAYVPTFSADIARTIKEIASHESRQFENLLSGMKPEEAHRFIDSTESDESENYHKLELEAVYPTFRFMNWGPTTDNLTCFLFTLEGKFFITYEFWREEHHKQQEVGQVFIQNVEKATLIQALKNVFYELTSE